MSATEGKSGLMLALQVLLGAVVTVSLAVAGYTLNQINQQSLGLAELRAEIASISASRFTSADGLSVWREIAKLQEQIAKIPNDMPPKWFQDKVDKLDGRLASIEAQLREHQMDYSNPRRQQSSQPKNP